MKTLCVCCVHLSEEDCVGIDKECAVLCTYTRVAFPVMSKLASVVAFFPSLKKGSIELNSASGHTVRAVLMPWRQWRDLSYWSRTSWYSCPR